MTPIRGTPGVVAVLNSDGTPTDAGKLPVMAGVFLHGDGWVIQHNRQLFDLGDRMPDSIAPQYLYGLAQSSVSQAVALMGGYPTIRRTCRR